MLARTERFDRSTNVGLASAGVVALSACTPKGQSKDEPSTPATSGTKGSLVWATHVYYNTPALLGISVGFRDFLDPLGWDFKVTAAKTTSDVQQTLQAQAQALALKPDAIVATMSDKSSFNKSLQAIRDAGIYLMLNNTQPDEGNGMNAPYIGQSFIGAGNAAVKTVLDAAVQNGKKDGVVLFGYCCSNQGAVGSRTLGQEQGLAEYNRENGTSFTSTGLLDVSESNAATAAGSWESKLRAVGDKLVGIVSSGVGEPSVQAAKKLGKEPGFVPNVIFDVTADRLKNLEDGWFLGVVDQQPYAQGFIAAAEAYMWITAKNRPPLVYDTGSTIILRDGVADARASAEYVTKRAEELGISIS
jgi:ABC-type sugar transport system substrate-binding protein